MLTQTTRCSHEENPPPILSLLLSERPEKNILEENITLYLWWGTKLQVKILQTFSEFCNTCSKLTDRS